MALLKAYVNCLIVPVTPVVYSSQNRDCYDVVPSYEEFCLLDPV